MGGFQGTLVFASVNTLKSYNGFRRDDLESLAYSILHLFFPPEAVPWHGLTNQAEILKLKI